MRPQCFHCGKDVTGKILYESASAGFNEAAVFPLRKGRRGRMLEDRLGTLQ